MSPLAVGEVAPDFDLPDQHRARVRLADLRRSGKAVLVVFYPYAFSGVCTGELVGFRDRLGEVETAASTLVAISCDAVFSQRALADRDGLFFPLLSDFWPHGEVARSFGVFDETAGHATRSSFLLGPDGVVHWSVHSDVGQARSLDDHAAAVRALIPALG